MLSGEQGAFGRVGCSQESKVLLGRQVAPRARRSQESKVLLGKQGVLGRAACSQESQMLSDLGIKGRAN